ncbi:MAG: penicillin-binding transpeptidase domain-containing protein [Candidatus Omnitrophica bacterium]|nr:penicillin-binding transpeptidase domain-containing protein [Candidatus Omnitrophota bacterium]
MFLQIIKGRYFYRVAQEQQEKYLIVRGERGKILDSRGRILSMDRNVYSLFADPSRIMDKEAAAVKIAGVLKLDQDKLLERLNRNRLFVWLLRGLDYDSASAYLNSIKLNGVSIKVERKRVYPHNDLAAQVLGAVDIDNNGISGVEIYYEELLKSTPGYKLTLGDGRNLILNDFTSTYMPSKSGKTIVLTIDQVIQYYAEEEARSLYQKYKAKRVSIVVLDPYTGEILSLANAPSFNPNSVQKSDLNNMKNFAISDQFEPGSVLKVISSAAVLDQNLVSLEDRIYCEKGTYRMGKRVLRDYRPYGDLDFKSVIVNSSNIGIAKSVQNMSSHKFYEYLRLFGAGDVTGVDLPGETGGLLRDVSGWTDYSQASIAMGQEIAVNCLHLAKIMSIIANGGYPIKPHIVKEIRDENGIKIKDVVPYKGERVISASTSETMRMVLAEVVEKGTGRSAKTSICPVAGKTGTAQKADLERGGYYANKYVATFMGFFPVDKPQLVVVVTVDEPQRVHFGGVVCAPAFKRLVEKVFMYLTFSDNSPREEHEAEQSFSWN